MGRKVRPKAIDVTKSTLHQAASTTILVELGEGLRSTLVTEEDISPTQGSEQAFSMRRRGVSPEVEGHKVKLCPQWRFGSCLERAACPFIHIRSYLDVGDTLHAVNNVSAGSKSNNNTTSSNSNHNHNNNNNTTSVTSAGWSASTAGTATVLLKGSSTPGASATVVAGSGTTWLEKLVPHKAKQPQNDDSSHAATRNGTTPALGSLPPHAHWGNTTNGGTNTMNNNSNKPSTTSDNSRTEASSQPPPPAHNERRASESEGGQLHSNSPSSLSQQQSGGSNNNTNINNNNNNTPSFALYHAAGTPGGKLSTAAAAMKAAVPGMRATAAAAAAAGTNPNSHTTTNHHHYNNSAQLQGSGMTAGSGYGHHSYSTSSSTYSNNKSNNHNNNNSSSITLRRRPEESPTPHHSGYPPHYSHNNNNNNNIHHHANSASRTVGGSAAEPPLPTTTNHHNTDEIDPWEELLLLSNPSPTNTPASGGVGVGGLSTHSPQSGRLEDSMTASPPPPALDALLRAAGVSSPAPCIPHTCLPASAADVQPLGAFTHTAAAPGVDKQRLLQRLVGGEDDDDEALEEEEERSAAGRVWGGSSMAHWRNPESYGFLPYPSAVHRDANAGAFHVHQQLPNGGDGRRPLGNNGALSTNKAVGGSGALKNANYSASSGGHYGSPQPNNNSNTFQLNNNNNNINSGSHPLFSSRASSQPPPEQQQTPPQSFGSLSFGSFAGPNGGISQGSAPPLGLPYGAPQTSTAATAGITSLLAGGLGMPYQLHNNPTHHHHNGGSGLHSHPHGGSAVSPPPRVPPAPSSFAATAVSGAMPHFSTAPVAAAAMGFEGGLGVGRSGAQKPPIQLLISLLTEEEYSP